MMTLDTASAVLSERLSWMPCIAKSHDQRLLGILSICRHLCSQPSLLKASPTSYLLPAYSSLCSPPCWLWGQSSCPHIVYVLTTHGHLYFTIVAALTAGLLILFLWPSLQRAWIVSSAHMVCLSVTNLLWLKYLCNRYGQRPQDYSFLALSAKKKSLPLSSWAFLETSLMCIQGHF